MKGYALMATVLLILFSCAGGPSGPAGPDEVPVWVLTPPKDTGDYLYFVGAGSDSGNSEAAARVQAAEGLAASVISFIGVQQSSENTAEAKTVLTQYRRNLIEAGQGAAEPQVEGFRIEDMSVERRGTLVNVYLLGQYEKNALLSQKSRLRKLFDERLGSLELKEKRADELMDEHQVYRAARLYVEVAAGSVFADLDEPREVYRRNMEKAAKALEAMEMEALNNNITGFVRQSFSEPFRLQVYSRGHEQLGLSGVPLNVSYNELLPSGAREARSASIVSDESGIAEFLRPAPRYIGGDMLTVEPDMEEILKPLFSITALPPNFTPKPEELRAAAEEKRVSFSYSVVSRAKEIPTAVWIVGFDNGGNALDESDASAGILEVLEGENFNVRVAELDSSLLKSGQEFVVEGLLRRYGKRYERLIYGSARISDFKEEGNSYTVRVSGSVKALDVESGILLYDTGPLSKSAIGQNPQSAMSAAFKQFGRQVGRTLSTRLP